MVSIKINNSRELRVAYEVLMEIESLKAKKTEKIYDLKRRIRDFLRERESELKQWCIKNYGDGTAIFLEELPEHIKTESEARDWFEYNKYIESPHSAYDCTGKRFTVWFKIVCRRGKYYAYHYIACDV